MYTLVESCVRPGGDVRERDADPFPPGTSAPPAPNHVVEVRWSQSAANDRVVIQLAVPSSFDPSSTASLLGSHWYTPSNG
jgi:hypothetical protein